MLRTSADPIGSFGYDMVMELQEVRDGALVPALQQEEYETQQCGFLNWKAFEPVDIFPWW